MRYDTKCTKRIVRAHKESARAERKRERGGAGRGEKKNGESKIRRISAKTRIIKRRPCRW